MAIEVRIPAPLQRLFGGAKTVPGEGRTVGELFDFLEARYAGIKERLTTKKGELQPFVNIYLNDEDIRFLEGEDTVVQEGDEVSIIPAIAGGAVPGGVMWL